MHCCCKDAAVSLASKFSEWRGGGGKGTRVGELAFPFFALSSTHPLLPAESFLDEIFVPRCGLIVLSRK